MKGDLRSGQIDSPWTEAIIADFFEWYKTRMNNTPIPLKKIGDHRIRCVGAPTPPP